jgi:hypothetical protein
MLCAAVPMCMPRPRKGVAWFGPSIFPWSSETCPSSAENASIDTHMILVNDKRLKKNRLL